MADSPHSAIHTAVPVVARLILVAVFAVSVVGKLLDAFPFMQLLGNLGLPYPAIVATHWMLLALEATAAVLLALNRRAGFALATGLVVVFAVGAVGLYASGIEEDCGCYGALIASEVGVAKIAQQMALVGIASVGWHLRAEA